MTPRLAPKHVMDAYEMRTGFYGFGAFLEQRGEIQIMDAEGFECQSSRKGPRRIISSFGRIRDSISRGIFNIPHLPSKVLCLSGITRGRYRDLLR
jgi:hypothetical protein